LLTLHFLGVSGHDLDSRDHLFVPKIVAAFIYSPTTGEITRSVPAGKMPVGRPIVGKRKSRGNIVFENEVYSIKQVAWVLAFNEVRRLRSI
jgi:hypothetical protein